MSNQIAEHSFKVGDVLVSKWGYGQTNVDFFEVQRVTRKQIVMEYLSEGVTEYLSNYMGEYVVPVWPSRGKEMRRKVGTSFAEDWVVGGFSQSAATRWDGKPVLQTHTH